MDVRTMAVMVGVVNVLLAVVLLVQYRLSRSYPGVGWWAAGQGAVAVGFAVSVLRGPSLLGHLAVPAYQALIVLGVVLILVGVLRFLGRRERPSWLVAAWLVFVAWSAFHTFVADSATLRSIALYAVIAVLLGCTAFALWRYRAASYAGAGAFTAVVFAAGAVAYAGLAVAEPMRVPVDNAFYAPSPVNAGAFLASLATAVLWTFGLVVMMNQRLAAAVGVDARNMHAVFATGPDCAIISRLGDGRIDDVNEGFTHLTGFLREDVIGRTSVDLGLWVDPELRHAYVQKVASEGVVADFPMRLRRSDGVTLDCVLAASVLTLNDQPYLITVARDVTRQRRMEAELLHEATTDSLTGLPNRRHFLAVCERELRRAQRGGGSFAVAVIDIDHFKEINDTHGHAAGDAAIVAFSTIVGQGIRDIDTLGRLGGDEFGLLLPDADLDRAVAAVERVRGLVAADAPLVDGHPLAVTLSAGVAVVGADGDTVDAMLIRADRALYDAKGQGRNRVVGESEPTSTRS